MGAGSFLASIASFHRRIARLDEDAQPAAGVEDVHEVGVNSDLSSDLQLLHGFHGAQLAERLHHLQLAGGSCPPHINWLVDAFAVTLSTHAGLQGILKSSLHSSSTQTSISDHERHTAEVAGLLDVCNALKQTMTDVEAHLARLETALHSIDEVLLKASIRTAEDCSLDNANARFSSFSSLRKATRRLSTSLQGHHECALSAHNVKLLTEASASLLKFCKRSALVQLKFRCSNTRVGAAEADQYRTVGVLGSEAAMGAMLMTLLVLASAVSSLTPPAHLSRKRSPFLLLSKIATASDKNSGGSAPIWVAALLQLQQELARSEKNLAGGGALFIEVHNVRDAAAKLERGLLCVNSSNMVDVRQDVKRLRKSLAEVQASTSTIRCQIASLFHELLAFRLHFL